MSVQIYTVRALDEFGRLYNNSYALGYVEDLKIEGVASLIMQKLVWQILKGMGEDAWAEWDCELRDCNFEQAPIDHGGYISPLRKEVFE